MWCMCSLGCMCIHVCACFCVCASICVCVCVVARCITIHPLLHNVCSTLCLPLIQSSVVQCVLYQTHFCLYCLPCNFPLTKHNGYNVCLLFVFTQVLTGSHVHFRLHRSFHSGYLGFTFKSFQELINAKLRRFLVCLLLFIDFTL